MHSESAEEADHHFKRTSPQQGSFHGAYVETDNAGGGKGRGGEQGDTGPAQANSRTEGGTGNGGGGTSDHEGLSPGIGEDPIQRTLSGSEGAEDSKGIKNSVYLYVYFFEACDIQVRRPRLRHHKMNIIMMDGQPADQGGRALHIIRIIKGKRGKVGHITRTKTENPSLENLVPMRLYRMLKVLK